MGAALKTTSFRGISRYNENAPTEAWNSPQGLTIRPEKAGSKMAAANHTALHPSALRDAIRGESE